jgi:hypothetical protein
MMTVEELAEAFEANREEYLKFGRIDKLPPQSAVFGSRPDLYAFMLLDCLVPGTSDMISSATHDEIYLAVSTEELAAAATLEQVITLIRCGVRYDQYTESLCMFV